ncbi:MAG: hypothetical protein OEV44_00075 [Spirochaetota bacterium]|nr:hypothetical protein [Spirochaetota bacterium]
MIVTKEHQEALIEKYIKDKHNQDECIGFVDGLNTALNLVKSLTISSNSNWVACAEREPDKEDTYYIYPYKYHYTAEYHKYGKWAGKWTNDDSYGYEYEVCVDYWKVIESPMV